MSIAPFVLAIIALTEKPWPEFSMFGGAIGCCLVITGVIGIYWRKS